jgi:DNA helicase-2/ATP-dependent DNA helicase PcrA
MDRTGLDTLGDRDDEREFVHSEAKGMSAQFRRGMMVRHPTFGLGRIAEVTDMGQHTRAVIEFNAAGRKTLILQYARLEPVG